MLTIKHIKPDGFEDIIEAHNVAFKPADQDGPARCVMVSHGMTIELEGGVIFVMNDSGKTVSKFDLEDPLEVLAAEAQAEQMDPEPIVGFKREDEEQSRPHYSKADNRVPRPR